MPSRRSTPVIRYDQMNPIVPTEQTNTEGSQSSMMNSPFPLDIRMEQAVEGYFDSKIAEEDTISLLGKSKTILAVINEKHILVRWEGIVDYVIEGAAPQLGDNMLEFWSKFDDILLAYRKFKAHCNQADDASECVAERTIPAGTSFYHFYFRGSRRGVTILRIIELAQYGREQAEFIREKNELEDFKNSIVSAISHNHITPLSVLDASRDEINKEMNQFRLALGVLEETIESYLQSQIQIAHLERNDQLHEVFKAKTALQEINKRLEKYDRKFRLHLRTVASQTSELRQKTLNMLAYSDICGNKFTIRMRDKMNLLDLCQEAHDLFGANALSKGVEFETSMNAKQYNPYVQIDAEKFKQALFAPLQNAIQFSHMNGQPIRFMFDMDETRHISFTITDFGCGISSANIDHVCEPFFVHHPMHDRGDHDQSLGLGLFLSKTFIEAMGGKIMIDSEDGVSTTVRITLPLTLIATHRAELKTNKQEVPHIHQEIPSSLRERRRSAFTYKTDATDDLVPMYDTVVISEDNKVTGKILKQFISKLGYKTELYETGSKALEKVRTDPSKYFMACLDYNIPADVPLTGADIGSAMQQTAPRLQILIVTANLNTDVRQHVESKGINEFMSKPFNKQRLTDLLKETYARIHELEF